MNAAHPMEDSLEMDQRTPVTRADLEGWGKRFKTEFETDLIQRIYRLGFLISMGFVLTIVGVAVAQSIWRLGMERRQELVEQRVSDIDEHGSDAVQNIARQVDSLRNEIRYTLPSQIIQQLEARGAWRPR